MGQLVSLISQPSWRTIFQVHKRSFGQDEFPLRNNFNILQRAKRIPNSVWNIVSVMNNSADQQTCPEQDELPPWRSFRQRPLPFGTIRLAPCGIDDRLEGESRVNTDPREKYPEGTVPKYEKEKDAR